MSVICKPGLLDTDSLVFTEDQQATTPLEPGQIEIEVKAVSTNFYDVFALLGKLNYGNSDEVGCECAGSASGKGFSHLPSSSRDTLSALLFPDNFTFAMASAIPLAGITAYYALARLARLCRGESILIHSGAGGTGQMAVQIAQALGAEVFVIISREEKRLSPNLYNIPEHHILQSRGVSSQRHIMWMTQGRSMDIVLNSTDIEANSKLFMLNFGRNVSYSAVAVDEIVEKPTLVRELLNASAGVSCLGFHDAFKLTQSGKNAGKLVIGLGTADLVRTSLHHTSSYRLPTAATYVIAGGLGGLGRSAARWMASMGAKNPILLSQSGPMSNAAQQHLSELAEQGVRVKAPRCDVTSMDSPASVLQECSQSGWPSIRGCIQGTMVLQDSIFETITFQRWATTLRSKVQSTQNLHALLPPDLDFFIILSSLTGIAGTVSEANYAAGNTFQDAFAAYPRAIGQHAVSLDLGYMAEVGIMAGEEKYAACARQTGISALAEIHEAGFHALLENYCRLPGPEHKQEHPVPDQAQILVGLVTAAQLRANGNSSPGLARRLASYPASDSLSGTNSALSSDSPARDWYKVFKQAQTDPDPVSATTTVVVDGITQKLSRALAVGGVDSLVAVELRYWISRAFATDVSALDIMSALSLEHLAGVVVAQVQVQAQAQADAGFEEKQL
ncbi:KR domain-containing protein [Aspergillus fruticulosus]